MGGVVLLSNFAVVVTLGILQSIRTDPRSVSKRQSDEWTSITDKPSTSRQPFLIDHFNISSITSLEWKAGVSVSTSMTTILN